MNRRELLMLASAGLMLPGTALGLGEATLVDVAELDLGSGTTSRPQAWKRLLYELIHSTSVECRPESVQVSLADPDFFQHPFTVLLGDGKFDMPSDEHLEQLHRYLSYGGFLFIDETSGAEVSPFDDQVRALCDRLFPTRPLAPLPADHSVYRAFFLLDRPLGRLARHRHLEGVTIGNLTPLIYCRNDLSGALERRADGGHVNPCTPGGERQRREAIKLGINLMLYCLTANYKKDQVHVRELMEQNKL
ncbi:MAG: DUF4159 domain-containing protein [Deltaproteobacteria bacterium]|nr:MAG: DUF4159 domain-containing protein [Deltaproteobacteria bacterium]